jgi:hypothetical protein
MSRPLDRELPSLFERAVDAVLQGERGFRSGAAVYNVYYCAGLAYDVAETLPADLCQALRLKCGSASYHDGGMKLKALMRRMAPKGG